jgi:cell division transport system permease protein
MARARQARSLRPRGFDDLGLRRALGDRVLPLLVAAMTFLAALALAGSAGAAALAWHWRDGAASALTVQVPNPATPAADAATATRLDRVLAVLRDTDAVADVHALTPDELGDLLRPWLGGAAGELSLPLPAVVRVRLRDATLDVAALQARLNAVAPASLVESHGVWVRRLSLLARSLQACAWLALAVVAGVAAAVIMVATRAGLSARRETIEIVHGLGATDSYIATRFTHRATLLTAFGAIVGAVAGVPVLLALAALTAPFVGAAPVPADATEIARASAMLGAVPVTLWLGLAMLPLAAVAIGFVTAQATVRGWLRRLP